MPEQTESYKHTSKIIVFPMLHTIIIIIRIQYNKVADQGQFERRVSQDPNPEAVRYKLICCLCTQENI